MYGEGVREAVRVCMGTVDVWGRGKGSSTVFTGTVGVR